MFSKINKVDQRNTHSKSESKIKILLFKIVTIAFVFLLSPISDMN